MPNSTTIKLAGALDAPTALGQLNPLFTPAMVGGILAEWDTDTGIAQDTSTPPVVASWAARTGSVALTPTTAGVTREGALNGHTAVRVGTTRGLAVPSINFSAARMLFGLFNVANMPASSSGEAILAYFGLPILMRVLGDGRIGFYPDGSAQLLTPLGLVSAGPLLVVGYQDATDGKTYLRVNGATQASATVSTSAFNSNGRVGVAQNDTKGLDGNVGAFGVAMGTRALAEVQKLEGYLAQRFVGTTFLPAGHPYRSTPPRKLT